MQRLLSIDVRLSAAIIAAAVSLLVALAHNIFAMVKFRSESALTRRSEHAIRKFLNQGKGPFVPFRIIRHHVGGYADDELRQLLVRCGALRFADHNMVEHWALLSKIPRKKQTNLSEIYIPASDSTPPSRLFPVAEVGNASDKI